MLESILTSISIYSILICLGVALLLGVIVALVYKVTSNYSKNFLVTLAMLPMLVASVIFIVNGNLGMSVAIAGTFSLIRFRSIAGTSKEIIAVFFAMALGLITGAGYIVFAFIITILGSLMLIIFDKSNIFERNKYEKKLKIVMPEDLDYSNVFDEIFDRYTSKNTLEKVKTTNLGSTFELKYRVILKKDINEKEFIDELRVKNGNLKISLNNILDDNDL